MVYARREFAYIIDWGYLDVKETASREVEEENEEEKDEEEENEE